jgi:hypothetical protein
MEKCHVPWVAWLHDKASARMRIPHFRKTKNEKKSREQDRTSHGSYRFGPLYL